MDTIYSDQDIDVYLRHGNGNVLAITFSNWTRQLRKPLWERETESIPTVFVVAKWNHWYQCDNLLTAVDVIRRETIGFDRVVTLGSSMGGFASLALAPSLGAARAVAISPQFSSNRLLTPFETRWSEDIFRIQNHSYRIERANITRHIIYDPYHALDAKHVAFIRDAADVIEWPLAFSGHPSGFAIDDLGIMNIFVKTSILSDNESSLFSYISQQYYCNYNHSVTAILNNYKYGDKSLLPTNRNHFLLGSNKLKEQVLSIIT